MFCLNDTMRYFLCPGKTDMRKGINSLCGVVHDRMGHDVRLGDVFILINRSRTTMSKPAVIHVFSATLSISIFVPQNEAYDDTRRSSRDNELL